MAERASVPCQARQAYCLDVAVCVFGFFLTENGLDGKLWKLSVGDGQELEKGWGGVGWGWGVDLYFMHCTVNTDQFYVGSLQQINFISRRTRSWIIRLCFFCLFFFSLVRVPHSVLLHGKV